MDNIINTFINLSKLLMLLFCLLYIILCPYTKVEESFNIQAIHDIMFFGRNITKYDHHEYPGVVPRTFIGPIIISLLSIPSTTILQYFSVDKLICQYVVRMWLGVIAVSSLWKLASTVNKKFGSYVELYFLLVSISQFHLLFYASRPLPNTFSLIFALLSISSWLRKDFTSFIWLAAFSAIIFRFELCVLFGVCLLLSLWKRNLALVDYLGTIVGAGLVAMCITIVVDSFFWQRWTWPESEVWWFNIILNKSSDYGTAPFYWYFSSVLPRCLLFSLFFIPWGIRADPHRCIQILLPALAFILVFSCLPHKELRFVIYTIPLLNIVAARGLADIHLRQKKSATWQLMHCIVMLLLVGNFLLSMAFLQAAKFNYPGGAMLQTMHNNVGCLDTEKVHLHICNLAAQSGVTRFGQTCPHWRYNKTEHIPSAVLRRDSGISHVIAEARSDSEDGDWQETHVALAREAVFAGLKAPRTLLPPDLPKIKTVPSLVLWQRKDFGRSKN